MSVRAVDSRPSECHPTACKRKGKDCRVGTCTGWPKGGTQIFSIFTLSNDQEGIFMNVAVVAGTVYPVAFCGHTEVDGPKLVALVTALAKEWVCTPEEARKRINQYAIYWEDENDTR